MKPKIFIASSDEKKEYAVKIAKIITEIKDCNFEPLPWYEYEAFLPGETSIGTLLRIGNSIEGVVTIMTEDDEVSRMHDEVRIKPRDNLIFECGLFYGLCGRERTLIVKESKAELPSDLKGIRYIQLGDEYNLSLDLNKWCKNLADYRGSKSIKQLTGRWIYHIRSRKLSAYGKFDILHDRNHVKMVKGTAYYSYGPANLSNLRGTWYSESVIVRDNDLKVIYNMKVVKKPEGRQDVGDYTGAFILHAIHDPPHHGQLKGSFSYLTEDNPDQGEIVACKIGELSGIDEREQNLPALIENKLHFDVLKINEKRKIIRRKDDRRNDDRRKIDRRKLSNQFSDVKRI